MTGFRLPEGGLIDRSRQIEFRFDGRPMRGHPGDTVVSALIANGVAVFGRSFKYHRPRGAWSAWVDDPNAVFSIRCGDAEIANCAGATTALEDGMEVRAVNAFPSARFDVKGALDRFARFLPAGFYYKTFIWPDWHLFEPSIRRMAGLGRLDTAEIEGFCTPQSHATCDLLVVGGGVSGLAAARAAAQAGRRVMLVDDHDQPGGSAFQQRSIDGTDPAAWVRTAENAILAAGGTLLRSATATGIYDHQLVAVVQHRGFGKAPRLFRVRAARCLIATGAIDRPLVFEGNDRPGVMSLNGAADLVARHAVLPGRRIAVAADHALAEAQAQRLAGAGAEIVPIATDATLRATGRGPVKRLEAGGRRLEVDAVLVSAGMQPLLHLWRHAGGRIAWCENGAAFLPGAGPEWIAAIGAANGTFGTEDAIAEAEAAATSRPAPARRFRYQAGSISIAPGRAGRQWVDFQNDVTIKDIELAARENFTSVEHLKRYTTLGMATDQGKTSNVNGLAALGRITGRRVPEVGTTTFRPPFVPVPLEIYRGGHRRQQFHPLKRLPLERHHRAAGAALGEYGGWLRPGWYGPGDMQARVQAEARMARESVGVLDASPLGKIEVMGPDAAPFLDFIYYNTISTLAPCRIRYGLMLREDGIVFDDGVVTRLEADHFLVSCSSGHVGAVVAALEAWRQDGNDPDRVFLHDVTPAWATITATGPGARPVAEALDLGLDLSAAALPHMRFAEARFADTPARVARVSFTGDPSYEISVPVSHAAPLWDAALEAAAREGGGPMGLEALSILRAEKGYVIVGRDTDGETMPHDLGFGGPRAKKRRPFVGDRALHTEAACCPDRRRLVGLRVAAGEPPLPVGAHVIDTAAGRRASRGHVSSSYFSPALDRPIALASVRGPLAKEGTEVELYHLGKTHRATVTSPCAFDPEGERLNA